MKITIGNQNNKETKQGAKTHDVTATGVSEAQSVKSELEKARRSHRRIYSCGYKKTIAEFYDKPVLYRTEDRKYHEVDNTLVDKDDCYETASNSFRTRFFRQPEEGKIFDLEQDGHKIELISQDMSDKAYKAEKNGTAVRINGVKGNSVLEYVSEADRIKENIIINSKSDYYEYDFELNISNLYAVVSDDGKSLELRNLESGRRQYHIPSPVMWDANGTMSDSVYYEITQSNKDKLLIKVIADASWINEAGRAFPVVIDPQIVIDNFYGGSVYDNPDLPDGEKSIFRYETYKWGWVSDLDALWIWCKDNDFFNSRLIIDKSAIPPRILGNLTHAELKLKFANLSGRGSYSIGGTVYFSSRIGNYDLSIDITDYFNSASTEDIVIEFENGADGSLSDKNFKFSSPVLELTSNIDYYGGEENFQPELKSISCAGAVDGHVYIKDGIIKQTFASFAAGDFVMPLNVLHIYTGKGKNGALGDGWRMNFDKQLTKTTDSSNSNNNYLYTDELGDEYLFIEKYFYYDNGQKKYISKLDVDVDIAGQLTYEGKKVYTEQYCNGYTLMAQLDGFNGVEFVEQRQDEQIQLENYVNQYSTTLKQYAVANKKDGELVYELSSLTKEDYNRLINKADKSSNYIILTEAERQQIASLILNEQQFGLSEKSFDLQIRQVDLQADMLDQNKNDYEDTKNYIKVKYAASEDKPDFDDLISQVKTEENNQPIDARVVGAEKAAIMADQSAYESADKNVDYIDINKKLQSDLRRSYSDQNELASEQGKLVKAQLNRLIEQIQSTENVIKETFEDYFNKEAQLELLYRQTPVNYIKGEDGTISGFNKYGDLVLEADAYGNYIAIDRDKDGLITEIYDNKNTVLTFEYANGKLASITDSLGRKVSYIYSGDMLSEVKFADGRELGFVYYSSVDKIKSVSSGDVVTEYLYDDAWQLSQISTRSKPVSIGKEAVYDGSDFTELLSEHNFVYDTNYTKITDTENNSEEYTFDEDGDLLKYVNRESTGKEVAVTNNRISRLVTETTTQQNSDPAVTVTRTYNDIRQITSEATDWQSISESVRVKTEVQYSYDLNNRLTEKKTSKYVETNGESKEIVAHEKYSYNAQGMPVLTESYVNGEEQTSGVNYEQKVYDDNGNVTKTIAWNSLDSSSKFYSESEVAENGQVTADKDETGAISAEYEYVSGSNVVNSVKYPNGGRLAYGRNPYNFAVTSVTQSTEEGEASTNDIVYKNGMPVEVKSGNTVISYTYDGKGRKKSYAIDGVQQATFSYGGYSESGGNITYGTSTQNLADGTAIVTSKTGVADSEGEIKVTESVKADGATIFSTLYNADGLTESVNDSISGTATYTYDSYKNVTKIAAATLTENYTYNAYSELTQKVLSGAVDQAYTYVYKDNAAHDLEYVGIDGYKFYPLSDVNGRNTGREIYSGEDKLAAEYITYRKVGDRATNMPASVWFATGKNIKDSIKYKYDSCGNICEITQNGHLVARYKYDSLNRLVREDNKPMNKTVIFTYDTAGNITERCEYAYTSKMGEELSELACTHYSYDYEGDRLVSYNGESVSYNALGNPTSYRGKAVEWQYGNRLIKFGDTTFAYDGAGRRVSKGSITFTYDSAGNLIKQSDSLEFIYDNSGVIGVKYNGNTYFYRRDCQGNIIAILDSVGNVVVEYKYDAWGNHEAEVASEDYVTLANLNPFRYRGYYYDSETDLYFLQTRYYDPEVGRFISRDSIEYADPETICGLNLYAYCGNNPVMNVDPTGEFILSLFLICLGVGLVAGAVTSGITAYNEGYRGWDLFGKIALGALTGAVIGAGVGLVAGMGTAAIIGGLASVAGKFVSDLTASVISQSWAFGSWEDYAVAFIFGGLLKGLKIPGSKFLDKTLRAVMDIAVRPLTNQVAKMGTRGYSFNASNYVWTVFSRTITYGFGFWKFTTNLFGQEFSIAFGKSIFRGMFSGIWKLAS